MEHSQRQRRGILVTLVVVVVVVVAVAFVARSVVLAASNYAAGKQALAAGRYDEAARKLADAKILAILPYADSTSLYKQARAGPPAGSCIRGPATAGDRRPGGRRVCQGGMWRCARGATATPSGSTSRSSPSTPPTRTRRPV